ncbi:MAG: ParA family protein [Promethearchaeota archaeon]
MTIISFINLKGGVGKTTVCANIAGELAHENRKVLVIDADPQANLSLLLMGEHRYEERFAFNDKKDPVYIKTLYQIFLDEIEDKDPPIFNFDESVIKSVVQLKRKETTINPLPTLDLLPSTYHLMELEQKIVHYVRTRYAILDKFLKKIKDRYEFILIDCPPNIYTATHNALYASDYYIIPTIPDYLSISGIPLLINNLYKTIKIKQEDRKGSVKLMGILINLLNNQIKVHREGKTRINLLLNKLKNQKKVDDDAIVFETAITNKVDVKKATGESLPVCLFAPRSNSTMEFKKLCNEIIKRINQDKH